MRKEDRYIILASDGLWDVMSSQDVVDYVLTQSKDPKTTPGLLASNLVKEALTRRSGDNITVLVVDLDVKKVKKE